MVSPNMAPYHAANKRLEHDFVLLETGEVEELIERFPGLLKDLKMMYALRTERDICESPILREWATRITELLHGYDPSGPDEGDRVDAKT